MVYIIIIALIIVTDNLIKHKVKQNMAVGEKKEIVNNKLYFWHIKNEGIAFNKLGKYPEIILCLTSGAITGFFIYLLSLLKSPGERLSKFSLSLVLGGAAGNLIDRIRNKNVTDFIYIKSKNAPIFNLADFFIVIGTIMFVFSSIFNNNSR